MRIVLKQSILDRAVSFIDSLKAQGRTVDKLVVTPTEMEELLNCPIGPNKEDPQGERSCFKDHELYIRLVRVETEAPTTEHRMGETILGPGVTVEGM